jgi:hypothetical protein
MTRALALPLLALLPLVACGGGSGNPTVRATIDRRVDRTVCVNPVGSTQPYCTTALFDRDLQGVHVGDCVDISRNIATSPGKIEVLDNRLCRN